MQSDIDFHISCITNDPNAHYAISQILSSQCDMEHEIAKYKRHNNALKTMMIESNRKMKQKVVNNISDCELRINSEYDIYYVKFSEMESRLKKDLVSLESKCDRFCYDLKSTMNDLLSKKMEKITSILESECAEFDKKYLNSKTELTRIIVEHVDKKSEELGCMLTTYKKNMKEMYNSVKNDHERLKEGMKTSYPEKIVHGMLEDLCKCDVESYMENKTSEYVERINNSKRMIQNHDVKIKESEKKLVEIRKAIFQENRNLVKNMGKVEKLKDDVIDQITSLKSPIAKYDEEIRRREQYHLDSYEEEMKYVLEEIAENKFNKKIGSLKKEILRFKKMTTEFERNPPNKINSRDVDRIKIKLKKDLLEGDLNKIIKNTVHSLGDYQSLQKSKSKQQSKKKELKVSKIEQSDISNFQFKYERLDNSIELISMRIKDIEDLISKQNLYLVTTSQLCTSEGTGTEIF